MKTFSEVLQVYNELGLNSKGVNKIFNCIVAKINNKNISLNECNDSFAFEDRYLIENYSGSDKIVLYHINEVKEIMNLLIENYYVERVYKKVLKGGGKI